MIETATRTLIIGSRTSRLAHRQTEEVIVRLQAAWPGLLCRVQEFTTTGDRLLDRPLPEIGGKGLFTAELEAALRAGEIDLAVHSLKDLPVEDTPGLAVGAVTSRADARDVLVARNGYTLATLPTGARVGTSSLRRQAQLLAARPDLDVQPIRGNVDTRAQKVLAGDYDAAVLAAAGLERLNLTEAITERLPFGVMLPAPGQGALAAQCRAGDEATLALLAAIDDIETRATTTAERAFLDNLGGGCSLPVAAYATVANGELRLRGLVASLDGRRVIRVEGQAAGITETIGRQMGAKLAEAALAKGAAAILAAVKRKVSR